MMKLRLCVLLTASLLGGILGCSSSDSSSPQAEGSGGSSGSGGSGGSAGSSIDPSDVTTITLSGTSISVDGPGATVDGTKVTVTAAGNYRVVGTLTDGQLRVDTADKDLVRLMLNNAAITCSTSSALYVVAAKDVQVLLEDGSQNKLTDGSSYVFETAGDTEPNGALFSKADLEITGAGALTVTGNYNDGIASKDSLQVSGGTISVVAKDDGLRGKDDITVTGGSITVTAAGDGLSSDNAEDASKGFIQVQDGILNVTAGGDGLTAATTVTVTGGSHTIKAGGGSSATVAADASAKGIKGDTGVVIGGGTLQIDAAEDALHSAGTVHITAGSLSITAGDDGIHSDAAVQIDGGDITVSKSYEGIEGLTITVNDGTIHVTSSDDGFNCAGGDGSGGGPMPGGPGSTGDTSQYLLTIAGGYVRVNASGDGLDSNGNTVISGGTVLVNGPTNDGNGALDIGDSPSNYFKVTGGLLVAAGSSGMAVGPGASSTQYSVLVNLTSTQQAGQIFHVQNSAGQEVLTYAPEKTYASVAFSTAGLAPGSYSIYLGGSSTGTLKDNLYTGGIYTPGTLYTTFTISSITTQVGQSHGGPGGPGGPGGK